MPTVKRTFWTQEDFGLDYGLSASSVIAPGSVGDQALPKLRRVKKSWAQLVCSRTDAGLHAPVLDIDLEVAVSPREEITGVHVQNSPVATRESFLRLRRHLIACGLSNDRALVWTVPAPSDPTLLEVTLIFKVPVTVLASSTPGHHHLYIDHEIPWWRYRWLLLALRDAGIIGADFCALSLAYRASFLRRPGVKKTT